MIEWVKKNHATSPHKKNHATYQQNATSPHKKDTQPLQQKNHATSKKITQPLTKITSSHKKITQPLKTVRKWVSEWKNYATSPHTKNMQLINKMQPLHTQKICNLSTKCNLPTKKQHAISLKQKSCNLVSKWIRKITQPLHLKTSRNHFSQKLMQPLHT